MNTSHVSRLNAFSLPGLSVCVAFQWTAAPDTNQENTRWERKRFGFGSRADPAGQVLKAKQDTSLTTLWANPKTATWCGKSRYKKGLLTRIEEKTRQGNLSDHVSNLSPGLMVTLKHAMEKKRRLSSHFHHYFFIWILPPPLRRFLFVLWFIFTGFFLFTITKSVRILGIFVLKNHFCIINKLNRLHCLVFIPTIEIIFKCIFKETRQIVNSIPAWTFYG